MSERKNPEAASHSWQFEYRNADGQYSPRPLIESIVEVTKPASREIIHDPACGTLGFLIMADCSIKEKNDDLFELSEKEQEFQKHHAFVGMELVPDTHRLALMNALLHDSTVCASRKSCTIHPAGSQNRTSSCDSAAVLRGGHSSAKTPNALTAHLTADDAFFQIADKKRLCRRSHP